MGVYHQMKEMFLFNDTLKTFYLQLYDIGHMVKDHSDRHQMKERERNVLFNNALNTFYLRFIWRQTYG